MSKLPSLVLPAFLKKRLDTCSSCEHKTEYINPKHPTFLKRDICVQRNCKCSVLGKAMIPTETCPVGKWKA